MNDKFVKAKKENKIQLRLTKKELLNNKVNPPRK